MNIDFCSCGSGKPYSGCCEPLHTGKSQALTAEQLMRARYSAYARHAIDFIISSCVPDDEARTDPEATREWSLKSRWDGLKIVSVSKGGPTDDEGVVEFEARYSQNEQALVHHESSNFVKINGVWLYKNGRVIPRTVLRAAPKIGRNDPCSCGSGKKFKHCCG